VIRRPRIVSYTSGRWPCGVATYQANLAAALSEFVDVETIRMPDDRIFGANVNAILKQRRLYQRLARRSAGFDAAIIDYTDTFWNGSRLGENLFPAFSTSLRAPATVILHERPGRIDPAEVNGPLLYRGLLRLVHTTLMAWDTGLIKYEQYINHHMLRFAKAIVMHSENLADTVRTESPNYRVHYCSAPAYPLAESEWSTHEVNERFQLADKTVLIVLGFPQVSKGFDRAIACLPHLPTNVVLVQVGHSESSEPAGQILVHQAATLGVSLRFLRTGPLNDGQLASVLRRSDLALVPFRSVHHSSSLGHLISAGAPILAAQLPTIERLANDGAGIAFTTWGEPKALAREINRLLASIDEIERLKRLNVDYLARHRFRDFALELLTIMNIPVDAQPVRGEQRAQ